MSTSFYKKTLFFILLQITFLPAVFGQKQVLKFNLAIGKTYHLLQNSKMLVQQDMDGKKIDVNMDIQGTTAYKVTAYTDSVYDITVSYDSLRMVIKMPNGDMVLNSEKPNEKDPFSTMLSAIKNKPFYIKMNAFGNVLEAKNLDSIFDALVFSFPALPEALKQQVLAQLKQGFGEKAFKSSFEVITNIYTKAAVEVGNTWEIKNLLETSFMANVATTYTFKENKNAQNYLEGTSVINTLDKNTYTKLMGLDAQYDLAGTANITLKVDALTGWIMEGTRTQTIKGIVKIKESPAMPGGLEMPMTTTSTTTYNSK